MKCEDFSMPASSPPTVPRLDHATLVAAVAPGLAPASKLKRREACKKIAAQVYRVVAAVLGPGSADVGDASQDAFMRVYNAIPSFEFDPERPMGPAKWVNQIALRAALDRLKDQKRRLAQEQDVDELEPVADHDPEYMVDRKKLVTALLERLNEKERAVLVLKYWNEETDEEIAATLGLPLGTVKTRLRAANLKLRQGARAPMGVLGALVPEGLKA
jgi:RNA polymerase sigma-70 factor, ECF subfamily